MICPNCEKEIDNLLEACPHCGCRFAVGSAAQKEQEREIQERFIDNRETERQRTREDMLNENEDSERSSAETYPSSRWLRNRKGSEGIILSKNKCFSWKHLSAKKKRQLGLFAVPALFCIILALFFFVIDNPKVHYSWVHGHDSYFECRGDYVDFVVSGKPSLPLHVRPYQLNYEWIYAKIAWEAEGQKEDFYIYDGLFDNNWSGKETAYGDWRFRIPRESFLDRIEWGGEYQVTIYGRHKGVLFNRFLNDIVFELAIPGIAQSEIWDPKKQEYVQSAYYLAEECINPKTTDIICWPNKIELCPRE